MVFTIYTEYTDKDGSVYIEKLTLGQQMKVLYRYKVESFLQRSHTYHQQNGHSTLINIGKMSFIISTEYTDKNGSVEVEKSTLGQQMNVL